MLRRSLFWGIALLVITSGVTLAGDDLGFLPFLLTLVGGLALGHAFVARTFGMQPERAGAAVHVVVALLLAGAIIVVVEFGAPWVSTLPAGGRQVLFVLQMAAIPAAGWIWLALISRVTNLISRRDAARRPVPVLRTWEREGDGDGSGLRFDAVEMRMRSLTLAIIALVVPAGLAAFLLLVVFDDIVMHIGARFAIIALGAALGLPLYAAFAGVMRRRALPCAVAFGNDELRVSVGGATDRIAYTDLQHLLWRPRSDYARVEVRGGGVDRSLITGVVRPPRGFLAELPPLPRRVFRRLELEGLVIERSRRDETVTFSRPGTDSPSARAPGGRRSSSRS